MADPSAPVQVFQGVDAGIQGDLVTQLLRRRRDLRSRLSFVTQLYRVFHQQALAAGGVLAVHHEEAIAFHIFLGHHSALVGAAESGGQGDVDRLISCLLGIFEQTLQDLGRRLCGFGRRTDGFQQRIKLILRQVHILLVFLLSQNDRNGNAGNILLFQLAGFKIRGGIGDNSNHGASF